MKAFTFEQQQHEIHAAADRERRRIRRAQTAARNILEGLECTGLTDIVVEDWMRSLARVREDLETSTRAPRAKRSRK